MFSFMSIIEINHDSRNPIRGPVCTKCSGPTRLTGIEPHLTQAHTDLRTYECMACAAVHATVVPLAS
jgi:hypothetical protein